MPPKRRAGLSGPFDRTFSALSVPFRRMSGGGGGGGTAAYVLFIPSGFDSLITSDGNTFKVKVGEA